jgi:hypothetical protein
VSWRIVLIFLCGVWWCGGGGRQGASLIVPFFEGEQVGRLPGAHVTSACVNRPYSLPAESSP